MQTRSIRGSGEPVWVIALLKCALTIGTRSAQSIMASGFTAAQTGRTHDRTRPMLQLCQKVLAKAPSTHDPKRTWGGACATSPLPHRSALLRQDWTMRSRPAAVSRASLYRERRKFPNDVAQPIHFANGDVRLPIGNLDAGFGEGVKDCHR